MSVDRKRKAHRKFYAGVKMINEAKRELAREYGNDYKKKGSNSNDYRDEIEEDVEKGNHYF